VRPRGHVRAPVQRPAGQHLRAYDPASKRQSKVEKLVRDGQLEADQLIKLVDVLAVPLPTSTT